MNMTQILQHPNKDQLERQLEIAKWIALATMVADHTGMLFSDKIDSLTFRTIGRLCWPLIAWIVAVRLTLNPGRAKGYLKRLLIWGIITQPVYWFTFLGPNGIPFFQSMLNIFMTLTLGVGIFMLMERVSNRPDMNKPLQAAHALAALALLSLSVWPIGVDYRYLAVAAIPVVAFTAQRSLPLSALAAGVMGSLANLDAFHDPRLLTERLVMPLVAGLIAYACLRITKPLSLPRLPRWFFYAFYPAHMIVLLILRVFIFPPI